MFPTSEAARMCSFFLKKGCKPLPGGVFIRRIRNLSEGRTGPESDSTRSAPNLA